MTAVLSSEQTGQVGGVSSPGVLSRALGPQALNASTQTNTAPQTEVGSLIAANNTTAAERRQSQS